MNWFLLENREKIMQLYKKWKKDYDKEVKKSVDNFIKQVKLNEK